MYAWMSLTKLGHPCSVSPPKPGQRTTTDPPELINIFEIFMPQLLRYPNPADPLNGEAAALLMRDPKAYAKKVETYVQRYATPADADDAGEEDEDKMGGPGSYKPKRKMTNGTSAGNGNGTGGAAGATETPQTPNDSRSGNGTTNGKVEEEDEDEDDDDMSDMGELSDGDEFMGEMDD